MNTRTNATTNNPTNNATANNTANNATTHNTTTSPTTNDPTIKDLLLSLICKDQFITLATGNTRLIKPILVSTTACATTYLWSASTNNTAMPGTSAHQLFNPLFILGTLIGSLITPAITAGMQHIACKLWGATTGKFIDAWRITWFISLYSLLGWIPVVGVIAGFYAACMQILCLQKAYNLSLGRSLAAFATAGAITSALAIAAAFHVLQHC